jgi:pimeloyl-ACP methyl ester carboxylesterase
LGGGDVPIQHTRWAGGGDDPSPHQRAEPIFYLEGGPGITNTRFDQASRYVEDRDVVLVGYRGVDGSVRLECPEVASALVHSTDFLSDEFYRASGDAYRSCADRLTDEGVDLAGYGLPQEADDLEAARLAFGYDRVHLLSQSAGTRRALIYTWRHPDSVHRSVMIGVNPPGHFLWDPDTMDEQLDRYAALCAEDPSCSERTDDLAATMSMTGAQMPDRWLFLPINESNVRVLAFYGITESSSEVSQPPAPQTFDAWLSAAEGDPSGLWYQSFFGEIFPIPMVWGQYAASASIDVRAVREYFASVDEREENLGYVGTAFAWGGAGSPRAGRPRPRGMHTTGCAHRTWSRSSSAGSSTPRRRRRSRPRSCSRTCRTATRSCCPRSDTP